MNEMDAMSLMHYLRARGYVAHAEYVEVDGAFRWKVVATRLRARD